MNVFPDYVRRALNLPMDTPIGPEAGPTLRYRVETVNDPRAEVDLVQEALNDAALGRVPRSAWSKAQDQGGSGRVTLTEGGPRYNGRTCCYAFLADLEQRSQLLALPWIGTCAGCGATYRLTLGLG